MKSNSQHMRLWVNWVLGSTLAPIITLAPFLLLGVLANDPNIVFMASILAISANGASVSVMQWLVLRRMAFGKLRWIPISAISWFIALLVGQIIGAGLVDQFTQRVSHFFVLPIVLACAGFGIGLAQWFLMRTHIPKAGYWLLANIVGWTFGGIIWWFLVGTEDLLGVSGLIIGTFIAAVTTGCVLVWLLYQENVSTAVNIS